MVERPRKPMPILLAEMAETIKRLEAKIAVIEEQTKPVAE